MSPSDKKGGIDPAALAVASLAAAVSVSAPPGPYGPASLIIGFTIVAVIFAYDKNPKERKGRGEKMAFSAVCALISVLMLGYPLECISAAIFAIKGHQPEKWHSWSRLFILFQERADDIKYSQVPPFANIVLWVLLLFGYYKFYPEWLRRRAKPMSHDAPLKPATH